MLTGDKEETAVNISYSAGHFHREMIELRLTKQQTRESCEATNLRTKTNVSSSRALVDSRTQTVMGGWM